MPPSSDCANGAARCTAMGETAEERFHTLARGWLAYPVTPTHHPSTAEERLYKRDPGIAPTARCTAMGKTAEERLYKRHPGMRQRRITHRNPIRTTRQRRAHGASAGTPPLCASEMRYFPLSARCTIIEKPSPNGLPTPWL